MRTRRISNGGRYGRAFEGLAILFGKPISTEDRLAMRLVQDSYLERDGEPVLLAEAVMELLWRRGLRNIQRRRQLENAWKRIAPGELAGQLRLGSWRRGVLELWTQDAALYHRLTQFEGNQLLRALQRELGVALVSRLRFRLG